MYVQLQIQLRICICFYSSTALVTAWSTPHFPFPLIILKYPCSPHFSPQLFLINYVYKILYMYMYGVQWYSYTYNLINEVQ